LPLIKAQPIIGVGSTRSTAAHTIGGRRQSE
jgi:hypothetical protein